MNHKHQKSEIIHCFDEMNKICWGGVWRKTAAGLLVFFGCAAVASMTGAEWLFLVGVFVVIAGIILPHVIKIHLGYCRLRCPSCNRRAGASTTKGSRVHLVCQHCATVSPTDCGIDCEGGAPFKIE